MSSRFIHIKAFIFRLVPFRCIDSEVSPLLCLPRLCRAWLKPSLSSFTRQPRARHTFLALAGQAVDMPVLSQ